ncbi:MAG: DUF1616 domain-containing protein, partial [Thaumarchaeota archaeon]|nr:DUF1616 domain-containing protein [Nitrososphaerota archaeon]
MAATLNHDGGGKERSIMLSTPLSYFLIAIGVVASVIGGSLYSVTYYNVIKCESEPFSLCVNVQPILKNELYILSFGISVIVLGLVVRDRIDRIQIKKTTLVIGVLVVLMSGLVVFAAAQGLSPSSSTHFSELSLLNSQKLSGPFPSQVVAGQNFSLYVYVTNHEGVTERFQVIMLLGNGSTVVSSSTYARLPAVSTYT